MGDKCCALPLLLAFLVQTTVAQYSCTCMRPVTQSCPTTFATPAIPTATNFPTHQLTGFLPQTFLPQYCQPQAYIPQGLLPQVYQSPTIVVPIPAPPPDCKSANTTVHQEPPPAPGNCVQHSPHPVVVQSVYVGRKEDDEKDKKECTCKEKYKKKKMERNEDHDEYEDMDLDDDREMRRARNRRNRIQRRNSRLRLQESYDPYYAGGYYDEPMMYGGCCSDCCGSFCPSRVIYID